MFPQDTLVPRRIPSSGHNILVARMSTEGADMRDDLAKGPVTGAYGSSTNAPIERRKFVFPGLLLKLHIMRMIHEH